MGYAILLGIGLALGFSLFIVLLIASVGITKKLTPKRATVRMWKDYQQKELINEDFREADFVTRLIADKSDDTIIPMPKGYFIKEKSEAIMEEKEEGGIGFRTTKERWIVKVKPRK